MSGWVHRHMQPILLAAGFSQLALGLWMAVSPSTFFDVLGGFGAENAHYVRDVSTVYFALGIAMLAASVRPPWRPPILLVTAAQYAFHAINHVVDVGSADPSWVGPLDVATIGLSAAFFGYLSWIATREEGEGG